MGVREATEAYGPTPRGIAAQTTVGVRELRQNLSIYLDEVKQGKAYVVTEHGQAVALLRPLAKSASVLDRLVAEGKAMPPRRPATSLPRPLDLKLKKPLSQTVIEMRDEDPW